MKNRTKPTNTSNKDSKAPIKLFDEYLDMFSFRQKPVSEAYLEKLFGDLLQWALNDEDALVMSAFFSKRGIGSDDIRRWRNRFTFVDSAYKFALSVVGSRREHGALKKNLDAGMVRYTMPAYGDKEFSWTELEEWRAKMRAKESENVSGGVKIVVMEKYPESELVPKKEKSE